MTRDARALVLVVGSPSPLRDETSQLLIEQGMSVVVCSGPSLGCMLDREDRCILRDAVQATVVFGGRTPERFAACRATGSDVIVEAGTHPDARSIARRTAAALDESERRTLHAGS